MKKNSSHLRLKYLGIDTYNEPVIYMRKDCHICRSEGFEAQARVKITVNNRSMIATLNTINTNLILHDEASLSQYAWKFLAAEEGDEIFVDHPQPLLSLSDIRSKIYGHELKYAQTKRIINDINTGLLSDIHIAMFLTATAGNHLSKKEVLDLTEAMINTGQRLNWSSSLVVDKHSVGGLPGNRTTLIVVPIVAAFGLIIPKTSSRAITSPAGTADTMEVLAPVELNLNKMQKVVERENGCIIWGGSVALSPADDILIHIERAIDLDSEGQLVASVLSKKIAAGSTHLVIDMPIGPTAKVRSKETAIILKELFEYICLKHGITIKTIFSNGTQPIGRGIGPALEAQDILSILQNQSDAPQDLREHALELAGHILEFSPKVQQGEGRKLATSILNSGKAWKKFQAICEAQGGMREIPKAHFSYDVTAQQDGKIINIDNRYIARLAKLAGAPNAKAAGVLLHVSLGAYVVKKQPLFTVYADTDGELNYALMLLKQNPHILTIE